MTITLKTIFDENNQDESWKNQVAEELNCLLRRAEYFRETSDDESDREAEVATLSIVRRVAQFESIAITSKRKTVNDSIESMVQGYIDNIKSDPVHHSAPNPRHESQEYAEVPAWALKRIAAYLAAIQPELRQLMEVLKHYENIDDLNAQFLKGFGATPLIIERNSKARSGIDILDKFIGNANDQ